MNKQTRANRIAQQEPCYSRAKNNKRRASAFLREKSHSACHGVWLGVVSLLATGLFSGCQNSKLPLPVLPKPHVADVHEIRMERKNELLSSYEERRDMALFRSAESRWQHADAAGSTKDIQKLLQRRPEHRKARLLLAEIYLSQEDLARADRELLQLLSHWPEDKEAMEARSAIEELRSATDSKSQVVKTHHRSEGFPTRAALMSGNTQGISEDRSESKVRLTSGETLSNNETGKIEPLPELPSHETRLVQPDSLTVTRDDKRGPLKNAIKALRQERPQEAVQILQPAVSEQPDNLALKRTLGVALYRSGDASGAQIVLQQALSLDKRDPLSYFLLGCVLETQGKSDEAEEHFLKANRLDKRL